MDERIRANAEADLPEYSDWAEETEACMSEEDRARWGECFDCPECYERFIPPADPETAEETDEEE